ncbi:hypothetical protein GWK47_051034 [Chionoecetes opilio]|uniref:Uncharacterized protein n=1 Tax=Chionoecetes opilio TaxID=41210 RepID=A0A8J4Y8H3_CHIOP|nr:hypothetical protein GWK47_051034 [Chionoecetes opilio]
MDVKSPPTPSRFGCSGASFRLTKKEERGLQRLCLFVVRVYAKAWIEASFSVQAPRLDLELIKALGTYDKIDPEIGDVALSKLVKPSVVRVRKLVGLSFFDSDVSCETKNAMVTALRREEFDGEDTAPKRVTLAKEVGPRSPPGRLRQWTYSPLLPEATPG